MDAPELPATTDFPATNIAERFTERGWTLATAESCTGGLISHRLTTLAGVSSFYMGGVVAYSNEVKRDVLGVRGESLAAFGAVSEEVAREMAQGARRLLKTDFAVAVTGIAGPTGGTLDKPVGLVYIAVDSDGATRVTRNQFDGTRQQIKALSADAALNLLAEFCPDN